MGDVSDEWVAAYDAAITLLSDQDAHLAATVRSWLLDGVGDGPALLIAVQTLAAGPSRPMSGSLLASAPDRPALRVALEGLPSLPPHVAGRFVALVHAADGYSDYPKRPLHALTKLASRALTDRYGAGSISFPVAFLERLCTAYGIPTSQPLLEAYRGVEHFGAHNDSAQILKFEGYPEYVGRHETTMRELLSTTAVSERLAALELVEPLPGELLTGFAGELAVLATSGSVKVRAVAEPLLDRCGEASNGSVRGVVESGKPDARLWALRWLWTHGDAEEKAWCEQRAQVDKAGPVRMLVEEWASLAATATDDDVPIDRPVFDWRETVSERDRDRLRRAVVRVNDLGEHVDPGVVDQLVAALAAGRPDELPRPVTAEQSRLSWAWERAGLESGEESGLGLAGTAALLFLCGDLIASYPAGRLDYRATRVFRDAYVRDGRPTLAVLSVMLDDLGADGGTCVLFAWGYGPGGDLGERPDAEVAEFAALHLDTVLAHVAPAEREYGLHKRAPHRALATLPVLPARAVDHLYAIALGPQKAERRAAQDLLDRVPGLTARIVPVLVDSRADQRAEAAAWLGRIADAVAVEPLEKAFAKEKQDVPMAAMLDALQAFGKPVEDYLRPAELAEQARKAVTKGLPKDLEWFPWEKLPTVRWAAGGDVPLEVLQWFLSQALKGKTPEPNALLRTYTSMFEPRGREELGQVVLEAWVAEDTKTHSAEEATERFGWEAQHLLFRFQNYPQEHTHNPLFGKSLEEIEHGLLPEQMRRPVGSASSSKGVLAMAAACAGEGAAPMVQRYLKQFQALRRTQGQALVAMLAWVDHPSATQVLLAVGSRFRSKSIQAEATKQVAAVAERKGWTVTELEDRSVPVAGLDEDGVLELSYGERTFTARLLPDLSLELRSADDTVIKTLPAPRVTDDEEAAKEAKKALAATKKELAAVLEHQTARLYEAMCTQRTWELDVWQRFVLDHPVLRHLASRLVWSVDGALVRPMGDGSLTNVDDAPVEPGQDARVSLAHESQLPAETAAAWARHLADYEVVPLFPQLGRGTYELTEKQRTAESLRDLEGSMIESFALRGRAGKLGYRRGEAGDGATFTTYERSFGGLGLVAVVNFSGNTLPEENVTVALTELSFERPRPRGARSRVALGDVPAVLLSEAWNDLREIADGGTGMDPDWQSKVMY